jgi:hypothetical protein
VPLATFLHWLRQQRLYQRWAVGTLLVVCVYFTVGLTRLYNGYWSMPEHWNTTRYWQEVANVFTFNLK